jgi:hypothetical protein
MPRYLTKSRFKLALECETKLFYTKKEQVYADQALDDAFLRNLAEGGYQVGELAKYYFCDDPLKTGITIETHEHEEAIAETQRRINAGETLIAEAAFNYENLFIRTDILKISTSKNEIELYEVKAKSYDSNDRFFSTSRKTGEITGIRSEWKAYLMDVAFQKYVLKKCFPEYKIYAYLMMADKEAAATVDGINQMFKIDKTGDRVKIAVKEGLKRDMLGAEILIRVNVDEEVKWIWEEDVDTDIAGSISFASYIALLSQKYHDDEKLITTIGSKCKKCKFRITAEEDKGGKLKSGFKECWLYATGLPEYEINKPLVTELWCGGFRGMQSLIDAGIILLENVSEEMMTPKTESKTAYPGLTPLQRRVLQVEKVKTNDETVYLDKAALRREMEQWTYPLHFIDFETSRVALPFHTGRRPYEQIAFQFSHHIVKDDHSIEHKGEYISFEPGVFPNYDFLRALKKELEMDDGTIFRYHNHENTVLNEIYEQLRLDEAEIEDKEQLMDFIKSITHRKDAWTGERDMVDLYKLVTSYYYPPAAGGSNSLKYILPATIKASEYLQKKYGQPVYGTQAMPSLNFKNKIWLNSAQNYNPYKALPPVFEDYDQEQLDCMFNSSEEIAEGGAAMTAYAKLQFGNVPNAQREMLRDALLKYCELDTLAMVMIWEYWMEELNNRR